MGVPYIPPGYHSVTPYVIVQDANSALSFYRRAFGATEKLRLNGPGNTIAHAEFCIGNSVIMLADEHPEMGAVSPFTLGGSPVHFNVYVPDCDAAVATAVAAGAVLVQPVQDKFYGDRSGTVKDPFGHQWTLSTHIEDLTQKEVDRRFAELLKSAPPANEP